MKRGIICIAVLLAIGSCTVVRAQDQNKVWFDGLARSHFNRDVRVDDEINDTVSVRNSSGGYNLLDLNTHINPLKDFEVFAQLRVRNAFGGFFGSGTTIDVRQLRASGVIDDRVRFNIGDIFLKQTRFTLFNPDEEFSNQDDELFPAYQQIRHYENFYQENSWRLQGLQADFSFAFDRFVRTLAFDAFITRPRGSTQVSNGIHTSDALIGGGSAIARLTPKLSWETHYINFFEVPSSGTTNISIRNPVGQIGLNRTSNLAKGDLIQTLSLGASRRYWLYSNLPNAAPDSISYMSCGMFAEYTNRWMRNDSIFSLEVGYRYVDPGFRSTGAQTRRIDFGSDLAPTVFPTYTNASLRRPVAMFDVLTDIDIYNQNLSGTLMVYNPAFSNVLPYGDATPNRHGGYVNVNVGRKNGLFSGKVNTGFFTEVVGQGTPNRRSFTYIDIQAKVQLHKLLNRERMLEIVTGSAVEITRRAGTELSSLDLFSHLLNIGFNAQLTSSFFLQGAIRQLSVSGDEFYTVRDSFGHITNYVRSSFDQRNYLSSFGLHYRFSPKVYANLHYQVWAASFDEVQPKYKYRRLFMVISVDI